MDKVVPVLRIYDYAKTIEFYVDWLGFTIEWEHRFGDNSPLYMQIVKGGITLHLTQHHGDCTPGAKVYIETTDVVAFHQELIAKQYRYNKPGLEQAPWNAPCMTVIDPCQNKILFTEKNK